MSDYYLDASALLLHFSLAELALIDFHPQNLPSYS